MQLKNKKVFIPRIQIKKNDQKMTTDKLLFLAVFNYSLQYSQI